MKIEVHAPGGPDLTIPLPNALLFSPALLNFGIWIGDRYSHGAMPDIPPETVKLACQAILDHRNKFGPWELVHVESADGATVIIIV